MTYAVLTLGCKLNQADSAEVAGRLGGASKAARLKDADLIVLNTCTVTHRADREARRLIRAVRRSNPGAVLAVMGCAVKRDAAAFRAMPEVDAVLESRDLVDAFLGAHVLSPEASAHAGLPCFGGHTRAFLKIQEGCNFPCTYCIVPSVRGPSRSVPPGQVADTFAALMEAGYKEVVLTGINTGEYGRDLGVGGGLPALLERLLALPGRARLRLNSVEPRAVTPGLVSLLKHETRLCRHVQIPLQSGSNPVLSSMRRNYRAEAYGEVVTRLAEEIPGIGLGADVMAGYPTESGQDHETTLRFLESLPLAFVHVFSYSSRPGTAAAALAPLPAATVAARAAALRRAGEAKASAFVLSQEGKILEALTLAPRGGRGKVLTDNFLQVDVPQPPPANRWAQVSVERGPDGRPRGEIVSLD